MPYKDSINIIFKYKVHQKISYDITHTNSSESWWAVISSELQLFLHNIYF